MERDRKWREIKSSGDREREVEREKGGERKKERKSRKILHGSYARTEKGSLPIEIMIKID